MSYEFDPSVDTVIIGEPELTHPEAPEETPEETPEE